MGGIMFQDIWSLQQGFIWISIN